MNKFLSVSPLLVFVVLYLVTSIVVGDFYKVPITVAFIASSMYAIALPSKVSLAERVKTFSAGAGESNIMLMIWIFTLAGSFAASAKSMGSIDATVDLALCILPNGMLMAGLFLAACFISISIGTSVGTIVALTPIAVGVASATGSSTALLTAVVVGGAFFGDNLSFISDTTIVATQTQGCKLSDKFRVNIYIVLPVAIITFLLYIFLGSSISTPTESSMPSFIKVLPYIVVLVVAAIGTNVLLVLTLGIFLTGIIGMCDGSYDFFGWLNCMASGIRGMADLIIVTMLAGGMLEVIKSNGGIDAIISVLTRHINGKRGAYATIAALVSLCNVCTANNTVAIITTGGIAKQISDKYNLNPRKCASILDTFSCSMQGILPYGAQLLMAAGLASLNPVEIISHLYYQMILFVVAIAAILFNYPRKYS